MFLYASERGRCQLFNDNLAEALRRIVLQLLRFEKQSQLIGVKGQTLCVMPLSLGIMGSLGAFARPRGYV